jgi:putative ABC transport system permease protein
VYDPSLSPSPQEQRGRAYLSSAALGGAFDQLKVQIAGPGGTPSHDRAAIVAAASEIGQWLQREQALVVREIQVPQPYAHPHQWQADALLAALLAGAAATLLLSAILAATMLGNLFTRHIPQIGIMKAIGARTGRIGRYYLTMIVLIAVAATVLAAGPAIWLGRTAVATFLGFLGIQPASLWAPAWAYAVVLAAGLSLPPLLALVPLIRASRTTVRAAIDHHGGAAAPGRVFRLGRLRGLNRALVMAVRNTVRRPARFWLSAGLLATAGMVFVAGMSLSDGTNAVVEQKRRERTWDVDVQLARPVSLDDLNRVLGAVPGVRRVDVLNVTPAGVAGPGRIPVTRTYPDQGHGRVSVTAVPAGMAAPKLLEGRWLTPGETGAVVLNQITRDNTVPGARAGDTIQLIVGGKTTTWRVAGIAEETLHGAGVYATAEGFAAAMGRPPQGNQLRVITDEHDEAARRASAAAVGSALAAAGVEVSSAASVSRADAVTQGHLGPVILILLGIALPLGVVGVVGLASTMSANVLDRTREFGVMHAIGARPKTVRRIVIAEGVILAVASCLLAVLPALGLTAVLGEGLGSLFFDAALPYRISLPAAILWLGIVVLGSVLATEAAATRASRMTVREAMMHHMS